MRPPLRARKRSPINGDVGDLLSRVPVVQRRRAVGRTAGQGRTNDHRSALSYAQGAHGSAVWPAKLKDHFEVAAEAAAAVPAPASRSPESSPTITRRQGMQNEKTPPMRAGSSSIKPLAVSYSCMA